VRVADYHANLIYNEGGGTAEEVGALIAELKNRVRERFRLDLEEEVQFL
jgi:UDP-N-acetylmuramate dehydrogenase